MTSDLFAAGNIDNPADEVVYAEVLQVLSCRAGSIWPVTYQTWVILRQPVDAWLVQDYKWGQNGIWCAFKAFRQAVKLLQQQQHPAFLLWRNY